MTKIVKPNTPLVDHMYTADPSAHVFEGKLYIYPSHDLDHDGPSTQDGDYYAMEHHKRCVKYTELKYNEDGTIQTIEPYK